MISHEITDSFISLLKVNYKNKICLQRAIIISLHRKLKKEKTKRHAYSLQNSRQNWSFEGAAVFQARETCARVRSLNSARFSKFRRDLLDMESGEELSLFEIKLEDEIFIPNKRVKQMKKEELLQNIEGQKSKNTERSTKTSLSLNIWKSCH